MLAAMHVARLAFATRPALHSLGAGPRAVMSSSAATVSGLASLCDRYDAFLLDQFGVLHDGANALPGAVDCFERLAASGKKLVVLSNTSRRRAFAVSKLPSLGFEPDMLTDFVCSGEEAWNVMAASRRGQKVLWLSWADDFPAWQADYLDGLDLTLAPAAHADFVLCQGVGAILDGGAVATPTDLLLSGTPSAALVESLATAAARGLPMLCANPDLHVTLPSGARGHMPGLVARLYEEQGGAVAYYGKPHAPAFAACLAALGPAVSPRRVLHVGDSLAHDVAGANAAGIDSLFIAGGIHAADLGLDPTPPPPAADPPGAADDPPGTALTAAALECAFAAHGGVRPTYTARAFAW